MNDIEWTRQNHALTREGGIWTVPRSGLIFRRTNTGFELINVMPYLPEMSEAFATGHDVPPSPSALMIFQKQDYECIKRRHEESGLTMTDPKGLLT